jgi:hypothetical protein
LPEGGKLVSFPASGRSRDAAGGEAGPPVSQASSPTIALRSWVGEWPCSCGQRYRVLAEPLTFWPQKSVGSFRTEPAQDCVSCGIDLADVFGLEAARVALRLGS